MIRLTLLAMLAWPPRYTPAQADAIIAAIVESDQEPADDMGAELGAALVRLWRREELWGDYPAPSGWHLKSEIYWTRQQRSDCPKLAELSRLPGSDEVKRSQELLAEMRRDLDALAEILPEWNAGIVAVRRAEIDEAACFYDLVANAQNGTIPIMRRQALQSIRESVGDRRWFAGLWPEVPWWRFPER